MLKLDKRQRRKLPYDLRILYANLRASYWWYLNRVDAQSLEQQSAWSSYKLKELNFTTLKDVHFKRKALDGIPQPIVTKRKETETDVANMLTYIKDDNVPNVEKLLNEVDFRESARYSFSSLGQSGRVSEFFNKYFSVPVL
jgi:hypothetical protein